MELFGEDSVVPLDLPVVAWGVRGDALVTAVAESASEFGGAVAGAVVGDHTVDLLDAVGGEEAAGRCLNPAAVEPLSSDRNSNWASRENPSTAECRYR